MDDKIDYNGPRWRCACGATDVLIAWLQDGKARCNMCGDQYPAVPDCVLSGSSISGSHPVIDERPRCEHGVIFPDENCARCLKLENIYLEMLVNEYARKLDVLRGALAAVEYADYENRCPWCKSWQGYGHTPNCERQRALGLA